MSNSNFTIELIPGYTFQAGELMTADKLNQLGRPNFNVSGSFADAGVNLGPGAVGLTNLQAAMFTPNNAGRAPFAAGVINAPLLQPDAYFFAGTSTGNGAAFTVAFTPALTSYQANGLPAFTNYWPGLVVRFQAHTTTLGGIITLSAGLGQRPIYRPDGNPLLTADIRTGQIVEVCYSPNANRLGTAGWVLMSPLSTLGLIPIGTAQDVPTIAGSVAVAHNFQERPKSYRWGLICQTNEAGYVAGAELDAASVLQPVTNASPVPKFVTGADAGNVFIIFTVGALSVLKADGTARVPLASASNKLVNWKLQAYANY